MTRISFATISMLILLFAGTAGASLIDNGNFDINGDNWVTDFGVVTYTDGAAELGRPGPTNDSRIHQSFDLPETVSALHISFDYIFTGLESLEGEPYDKFKAFFEYESASLGSVVIPLLRVKNTSTEGFDTLQSFDQKIKLKDLVAGPNNALIAFELIESYTPGTYGTKVVLDNVVAANPVPEPATMLLVGSGLLGLAGFGRKKFFKKK